MFTITRAGATGIAFVILGLLLVAAHVLIVKTGPAAAEGKTTVVEQRRRGVKALVMGADGRTSTSKVQAVLWTFAVFYAFVFLLAWGRSVGCGKEDLTEGQVAQCNQAADDRLNFQEIASQGIQADYYVLLGFPLGVAVAAKALTVSKLAAGAITKEPNEDADEQGVMQGLGEVVSNDSGQGDLVDFQYFAFNLIALAYFWIEFLSKPGQGLPELPATLIGLTGLSAAVYTARKAVEEVSKATVSRTIPTSVPMEPGTNLTIVGSSFGERDDPEASWVKIDGVPLFIQSWTASRIDATLDQDFIDRHAPVTEPTPAELVVDLANATPSELYTMQLLPPTG